MVFKHQALYIHWNWDTVLCSNLSWLSCLQKQTRRFNWTVTVESEVRWLRGQWYRGPSPLSACDLKRIYPQCSDLSFVYENCPVTLVWNAWSKCQQCLAQNSHRSFWHNALVWNIWFVTNKGKVNQATDSRLDMLYHELFMVQDGGMTGLHLLMLFKTVPWSLVQEFWDMHCTVRVIQWGILMYK